ncbi:hypothetical protein GCM10010517_78590 [Streptosporangium fragile]|uniref:Uncharacterized protein n=1 Tax=Streptosporangium fragile TaxID=46186 RepID=A0ABN3WEN5_9ACTN
MSDRVQKSSGDPDRESSKKWIAASAFASIGRFLMEAGEKFSDWFKG